MAINVMRTVGRVFDLSTKPTEGNGLYILGDASDGIVGTFCVHIHDMGDAGAFSLSALVRARSRIPQARTGADDIPFQLIPYLPLSLNGVPGTMAYQSTALTGESIILIPATGLEIGLDITYTSGHGRIYWTPLEGCAA